MNRSDRKKHRRFDVLKELVDSYIESCSPVSSEQICRALESCVSSATVRNTLAELDDLEWTTQPHSSAGRVPCWRGYRAYLDILRPSDDSRTNCKAELAKELDPFEMSSTDIGPGLQRMAGVLSELSGCSGVVLHPRFDSDFIRQIKLVPIDRSRVLVVVVSDFGLIRTETVQISHKLTYFSQKRVEDYINSRLHGRFGPDEPPGNVYDEQERRFGEEVYNEIVLKYLISIRPRGENELFLEGLSRIFDHPELQVPRAVHSVIEFFEDRESIIAQLRQALNSDKVIVRVGEEVRAGVGSVDFSMIAAPYSLDSMNVGTVGIIGPMRMPYRKLIPLVEQAAAFLSGRLAMNFRKPRLGFDRDIRFKVV